MAFFWRKPDPETERAIREFDAIASGMRYLFTGDSDIIDVSSIEPSFDNYKTVAGNVKYRTLRGRSDMRSERERKAAPILCSIELSDDDILMFCEFLTDGVILPQRHSEKDVGYIIDGVLCDRMSGESFPPGSCFEFLRMSLHEPYSQVGAFMLLHFS